MKLIYEKWRRFIYEQESEIQIYCDMDGVLVDFEGGVVDYINEDLRDESRVPGLRMILSFGKILTGPQTENNYGLI